MRRLMNRLQYSVGAHRENGERGAVAVLTALCLVALLLFAALAIDVGVMYEERAELQSSADAAALAVAQGCAAGGPCTLAVNKPVAQQYAEANVQDGTVVVDDPAKSGSSVKVTVHALDKDGTGSLALNFGFVTDEDEAEVGAAATAEWYTPNRGPAVLPIVFSPCDFDLIAGRQLLELHSITGTKKNDDTGDCPVKSATSGLNVPGGFGFIDPPAGQCTTTVQVGQIAYSDPGNDLPGACEGVLQKHLGKTVLLPMYKDLGSTGNKGWYEIDGWVAFKLLGWRFPSTAHSNTTYPDATCTSPCTGLIGEFERYATLDEAFTSGGPDHGAAVVGIRE